jgi:hypothetical protein
VAVTDILAPLRAKHAGDRLKQPRDLALVIEYAGTDLD